LSFSYGFKPQGANLSIAATTASASVARTGSDKNCEHISIYNANASKFAFVRSGVGAQTAVIGDFAIPPNSTRIMRCNVGDDTIAAILDAGATASTLYIQSGDGWS